MLTFEEFSHTYRFGGTVVPSVTQVLATLQDFSMVSASILEAAQLRGSNVHLMCQYLDEDCLDEREFEPNELAYLPAWKKFLVDTHPNWTGIEERVYHSRHCFAGTLDRRGVLEAHGPDSWVIDIKTSEAVHPCWALQTAAYKEAGGYLQDRRATVQLRPDGTYRFKEWKDAADWPVFVSLLTVHRWTESNL